MIGLFITNIFAHGSPIKADHCFLTKGTCKVRLVRKEGQSLFPLVLRTTAATVSNFVRRFIISLIRLLKVIWYAVYIYIFGYICINGLRNGNSKNDVGRKKAVLFKEGRMRYTGTLIKFRLSR